MPVPEAREAYRQRYQLRGPGWTDLPEVRDLAVPTPQGSVPARLYRPARASDGAQALILYFHGGGFVVGDIEAYDLQSRRLAADTGCQVLTPDYRLAPEHHFPAALEDAARVLDWVFAEARQLGADGARIAVAGDSAGGNLAALCAARARERALPLAAQALFYPVTDFTAYLGGTAYPSIEAFSRGYFLDRVMMEWFTDLYLGDRARATDPAASPILSEGLSGQAPALVVTAGFDPLRDMGRAYADRLREAGVPVESRCYGPLIHTFLGMVGAVDAVQVAFAEIVAWLRRQLRLMA